MYLLGRRWETITAAAAVDMAEVETETEEAVVVTAVAEATAAVVEEEIATAVAEALAGDEVAEASAGDEVVAAALVGDEVAAADIVVAVIVAIARQTKYLLRTKSLSWVSQLTSQRMKLANSSALSV